MRTAGSLLAGVPAANAGACIVALRAEDYVQAAIIGEALSPTNTLEPISFYLDDPPHVCFSSWPH